MNDPKETVTEITLTFEDGEVRGVWYHPALEPVICALCGKGCKEKGLPVCHNVNPWCG